MPVRGVVSPAGRLGWGRDRPYQTSPAGPQVAATVPATARAGVCGAILVEVNWGTPGVTQATLTRITPDGVTATVRGSPVTLSGGLALFWDVEAPLNTPVTYRVSSPQSSNTADSQPVTATTTNWGCLSDPLGQRTDVALTAVTSTSPTCATDTGVVFVGFGAETYDAASGVFDIIGSGRPRTVTQVRQDLATTLMLTSKTLADRQALLTLLGTGRDLLLRLSTTQYGWATDTYAAGWVTVDKVTASRPSLANMGVTWRNWKLPIRRVDTPAATASSVVGSNGVLGAGNTWADLVNAGITWNNLAGWTWADLIRGTVV